MIKILDGYLNLFLVWFFGNGEIYNWNIWIVVVKEENKRFKMFMDILEYLKYLKLENFRRYSFY